MGPPRVAACAQMASRTCSGGKEVDTGCSGVSARSSPEIVLGGLLRHRRTAAGQRAAHVPPPTGRQRRFEMLRDRFEILPLLLPGNADWTTLTDGVSMAPRPSPISSQV